MTDIAQHQPACQALQARHYGIGWLLAVIIWAEIGDVRRFTSSEQLVRYAGLDITVYSSDRKRAAGHLARQGSPELRWAVFEAAKCASHRSSPDYAYYQTVATRRDGKRATQAVARKLLRRIYHTLQDVGDAGLATPNCQYRAA